MQVVLFRLRVLLRARWRTVLILSLLIGVVGVPVLALTAGAARTLTAPGRYEADRAVEFDATVEQDAGPPRTREIAGLAAVQDVRTATFVFGALVPSGGDVPAEALVFSGSSEAVGSRILDGRPPEPSSPTEFAATSSFLEASGARIGDEFQLVTLGQAQADIEGFDAEVPEGPSLTATLVGSFTGPGELQDGYSIVVFSPALLRAGDVGVSASHHLVALAPGATMDDLRRQLDGASGGPFGIDPAEIVPAEVRRAVEARGQGIAVVAVIVALAAVVVLGQLLTRRFRLAEGDEAALRSVGMTPRQLVLDSTTRAAVPIVIGSIGAAALAIGLSGEFPLGFVEILEPRPGLRFDPVVHIGGAVVFAWVIAAWVAGSILTQRSRPREHASADGLVSRLHPAQLAMAARFAFTRSGPRRASLRGQFVGLTLVLAAAVAALTFGASLDRLIDEPARYGAPDLATGQAVDQIDPQVLDALVESPDIAAVRLVGGVLASVGATSVDIAGLEPVRGDMPVLVTAGRPAGAEDEIVLGRATARDLGVGVGDTITATTESGRTDLMVTGIGVLPAAQGGDGVGLGGVVTAEGLQHIAPGTRYSSIDANFREGAGRGAIERLSSDIGARIGPPDPPGAIVNLDRVRALPAVVAATLGLLAALALVNQLLSSARNRRHDIAVLGALGADRRWTTTVVQLQATLTALAVLVVAIPVGVGLGRVVFRAFIDRVGSDNSAAVPVWTLIAVVVATLVIANLAAAVPGRFLRRQPLTRSLQPG